MSFCKQVPSDADLKEHMVGIIFSRSKLTNLQKQVRFKDTEEKLYKMYCQT